MADQGRQYTIAMLVDGDNAQPSLLEKMVNRVCQYGQINIRRIYGDWTRPNLNGWKKLLAKNAFEPMQQFSYTTGKNSTDGFLIIDAMDILHSRVVDAFCLVSSDSDYTRLATRMRHDGYLVIGIGKKTTPKAFVDACSVFIFTEDLGAAEPPPDLLTQLHKAFDQSVREGGWANLPSMGLALRRNSPGFELQRYGYKNLTAALKAYPDTFYIHESGHYVYRLDA